MAAKHWNTVTHCDLIGWFELILKACQPCLSHYWSANRRHQNSCACNLLFPHKGLFMNKSSIIYQFSIEIQILFECDSGRANSKSVRRMPFKSFVVNTVNAEPESIFAVILLKFLRPFIGKGASLMSSIVRTTWPVLSS